MIDYPSNEVFQNINAQGLELGYLGSQAQFFNKTIEFFNFEIEKYKL